jgi:hypothetical protein
MRFLRKRKGANASALGNSANRVTAFTMKPMAVQLQEDVISRRRSMTGAPEAADGRHGGLFSVAAAGSEIECL